MPRAGVVAPDRDAAASGSARSSGPCRSPRACRRARARRRAASRDRPRSWRSARTTRRSRAGTSGSGSSARTAAPSPCGSGPRGSRSRPRSGTSRSRIIGAARACTRRAAPRAPVSPSNSRSSRSYSAAKLRAEGAPGLEALPAVDREVAQRVRAVAAAARCRDSPAPGETAAAQSPSGPVVRLEFRLPRGHDGEFPERREAGRRHQRGLPASHAPLRRRWRTRSSARRGCSRRSPRTSSARRRR